jgi:protein transport protein SEC31
MGGKYNVIQQTSSKIMDSFGDVPTTPPVVSQQQQITQQIPQLKLAPKWMRRTCGACFAFGGKLVTFGRTALVTAGIDTNDQANQLAIINNQRITINQIITDADLVDKSQHLEQTLQTGNLIEYCNYKIETSNNSSQSNIWQFILATFNPNRNDKFLELLGFSNENLDQRIKKLIHETNDDDENDPTKTNNTNGHLETQFDQSLNLNGSVGANAFFNTLNHAPTEKQQSDNFDDITRALSPINLSFKNDVDNLISQLLLLGKYDKAVDLCIQEHKYTDAILIANFFDKNLLVKAQKLYFKKNKGHFSSFLERFLNRDWSNIIETCNLDDWKDALAALLTYTNDEEFASLCDKLGMRLEDSSSENESNHLNACVCYILSYNFDSLVLCWQKVNKESDPDSSLGLQDLIEKCMVLRYSYQNVHQDLSKKLEKLHSHSKLNSKLVKYAKLLADQGSFLTAYSYVNDSNDSELIVMKDRIFNALDNNLVKQFGLRKPECPFKKHETSATIAHHHSSILNRKNSYQHAQDNSSRQQATNYYNVGYSQQQQQIPQQPQQQIPTVNNYPIKSMNHPMPTSSIYGASIPPPTPVQPVASLKPPLSGFNHSTQMPPTSSISQPPAPSSVFTPSISTTQPAQQQPQQPSMPSYMNTKPATAWNDPPMVTPKVKQAASVIKEQDMPTFFQPTMPVAPTLMPSMNNQAQSYYQSNQLSFSQPAALPPQHFDYNSQPKQTFNPTSNQASQQRVQPSPLPQQQPVEQKAIEKSPIPQENQIIQNVFDSLLNKCLTASNVPAIRRKLDDVAKKLEVLYDKLRDSSVTNLLAKYYLKDYIFLQN